MVRRPSKESQKLKSSINAADKSKDTNSIKVKKRTRKCVPRDSPPLRSSVHRGVTRHRWTGRYEAHLWDKNCWNESQNKKGRQVYLGAYHDEEAAARAYDLAALKYWGPDTILNFPVMNYQEEIKEMESQSREEYIGSLRRKSSGFSRGVSKYRGVARHHHNGRWEARIGRVFGNKYLYLGTYAERRTTQEEAATAYDMAAIEYRGLNAVTNFDLGRYIKRLRPNNNNPSYNSDQNHSSSDQAHPNPSSTSDQQIPSPPPRPSGGGGGGSPSSALSLLLQSSKFKEMLERTSSAADADASCTLSSPESDDQPQYRSFPDYIQTYFDCQESDSYAGSEGGIFGDVDSFDSPTFHCELEMMN